MKLFFSQNEAIWALRWDEPKIRFYSLIGPQI
jgi:hypothetical protein